MTTPATTPTTGNIYDLEPAALLEVIAATRRPLLELKAALEAELKARERERPRPATHNIPAGLRETLRQLRDGVPLGQGMDARLYAVLSTAEMARFRFYAPGLAPLERLRERLMAAQEPPEPPPPVLTFRYTGPAWGKVAGARRNTGDVVRLTADAAARWAEHLEAVVVAQPG